MHRGGKAGEKAATRWGHGGRRHGVVPEAVRGSLRCGGRSEGWNGVMPAAVCGPVAGPACRACDASTARDGGPGFMGLHAVSL